ncbi:hydrogenase/urease accessory protein HupE [Litorivivens lipolytica]|uniref:Hydrogenase/urease accessory protein HupE n=1 Tax=Litorivivens lipolytica TaxID=1524264 RepID=A0A7W4Z4K4_9GAMM|nr:HupE/UreJ family protein [Litorivivens lipolytica]MBB3046172.1 hydrogenase/urease accessory protein HupE [Litorivivens lipolytica]
MKKVFVLLIALLASPAFAHKLAPSLLEIEGSTAQTFDVLWRTPAVSGAVSPEPVFPADCQLGEPRQQAVGTSMEWHWAMTCPEGLEGKTFKVMGLTASRTAALLKIELADGRSYSQLLRRDGQSYTLPKESGTLAVVWQYFVLGIEHILIGLDHLLFVTGLLLLAASWKQLLVTVTAFTVGHSVTLACVSLGVIPEVASWVELAIAATILYLAIELSYQRLARHSGRVRWPVIAIFGLIHGLGFASVLDELGLPQNDILAGLVAFNVGIEVGQLLFVATLALLFALLVKVSQQAAPVARGAAVYVMGGMAVFWCLERAEGLLLSSFYFF